MAGVEARSEEVLAKTARRPRALRQCSATVARPTNAGSPSSLGLATYDLTYGELRNASEHLPAELDATGLRQGDRIAT